MIRRIDDELQAPKYAHIERERRFLVDPARRPGLDGRPHILIEDRYIDGTRLRLRRMTEWPGGRVVLKLGKKYGGKLDADDRLAFSRAIRWIGRLPATTSPKSSNRLLSPTFISAAWRKPSERELRHSANGWERKPISDRALST